jgi:putative AdoMet-dependent methyltransferase
MDFSGQMLELAGKKVPSATLVQGDIGSEWPSELFIKFDRIVSAYTIHHFNTDEKIDIIRRIVTEHLMEKGVLVIGDISFRTITDRNQARTKLGAEWDDSEFYWAADVIQTMLRGTGVIITYEQVSWCGGIYIILSSEDL